MPQKHDANRPWRHLYKTARWQRIRAHKLAEHPLCEWCMEEEIVEPATEVHHAKAHKGDLELFWNGPFVATCRPCHSRIGQMEDHGKQVVRFGVDGWPV